MAEKGTKQTLQQLYAFVSPYRYTFFFVAFLAILASVLATAQPYVVKIAIDDYIMQKDYQGLRLMTIALVSLLIIEVIVQIFFAFYANWLGQTIIRDMRKKLFQHLLSFKMKYYDQSSVGVLVTRTVNDIERIGEVFSSGLFEIVSDLLKMMVITIVMIFVDWKLALISYVMMPILLYATRWFQKSIKSAFTDVRKEVANLNSFVQEHIMGMKIVQLFTNEKEEYEKFKVINNRHKKGWLRTIWYNSIFFPVGDLVTSITIGLIVWYGGFTAVLSHNVDLGTIFMFIQLSQMLFRPLRHIADKFNTLQMGVIASQRVFAILDDYQKKEIQGNVQMKNIKGNIRFENVHFGYVPNQEVLHGISFEVKQGETVAIVGATGAGKSTIINLLNRFYEIQKGTIYIDGTDIRLIKLASLRKHIAVVLQDVFLFADSVLNNITLQNPNITEEQVIKASKEIGIHDFLMRLPGGYHYNVQERGAMLSAGQRQLIAFLRAYVNQPKILVLDEATSSVDSHSEQLIQQATDKITQHRTSIIIAHRLTTIKKANRIIVLDKGNIVESGNHQELLKIENGFYRNLYQVQFKKEQNK